MGETNLAKQRPIQIDDGSLSALRVGSDLRAARERLGWSLADTSAYVRIRRPFLEALEEGRVRDLPGPVYVTGFVRSYAIALGIDAEEMVRRYRAEAGDTAPPVKLDFPAPVPQRHVPTGAVVMLGALIAVGAYVGWYRASDDRASVVAVQQVPARLAPLTLPLVPAPPPRVAANAPAAPTQVASVHVPSFVPPTAAEAGVPVPGSLSPVEPPAITTAPGGLTPTSRLMLSASADAWVQVKNATGAVVMSKLMHAGDSWLVPDAAAGDSPMVLTTGNAGGTVLTLDGKVLPPMGANGVVKRDVALDPVRLATDLATAQAPAQP